MKTKPLFSHLCSFSLHQLFSIRTFNANYAFSTVFTSSSPVISAAQTRPLLGSLFAFSFRLHIRLQINAFFVSCSVCLFHSSAALLGMMSYREVKFFFFFCSSATITPKPSVLSLKNTGLLRFSASIPQQCRV